MKLIILLLSASLFIALNSCKTTNKSTPKDSTGLEKGDDNLAMGEIQKPIQLNKLMGKKIFWVQTIYSNQSKDIPSEQRAYLIFKDKGQLEIQSICNKGAGSYSLNDKALNIQSNMITKIGCKEGTIEYHFFKDLNNSKNVYQIGNKIFIALKDNSKMEFKIQD